MSPLKFTNFFALSVAILVCSHGRTFFDDKDNFLKTFLPKIFDAPKFDDDYTGLIELYFLEMPMLLKQLGNLGDDILLPGIIFERSWIGSEIWNIKNPRLINATHTGIHASMSGNQFTLNISVPSVEVVCPECIIESIKHDRHVTMEDLTIALKNYSLIVTTNLEAKDGILSVSNLKIDFQMGEFSSTMRNGTVEFTDGGREEVGVVFEDHGKDFTDWWADDEAHEAIEVALEDFLNCQLSSGKLGVCDEFFLSPLYAQTFSQILHGLGNAAIANTTTYNQPLADLSNPIDVVNKILFKYGTHVIQTTKVAGALIDVKDADDGFSFPFPITFNGTARVCTENGTVCQNVRDEVTVSGPERTTVLYGLSQINVICNIQNNNITYKYVAPNLVLNSTDYKRVVTNLETGSQIVYEGLELRINQAVLGVTANFSSDGGVISFTGMKVLIKLGTARMYVPSVTLVEDGKQTELPPVLENMGPEVSEMWNAADENGVTLEEKYSRYLQTNINDFLAGRISI